MGGMYHLGPGPCTEQYETEKAQLAGGIQEINARLPEGNGQLNQIMRSNGDGTSRWDSPATQEEIGAAVTEWLGDNVPTGTTVVVDRSLSVDGAAADAKTTGELKSTVKVSDNIEVARFAYGTYQLNPVGGDPVSETPATSTGMMCYQFECQQGDEFQISVIGSGTSTGGARAYAWLNSSRVVLSMAAKNTTATDLYMKAPANAAYLVVNTTDAEGVYAVKGNNISKTIRDIRGEAADMAQSLSNKDSVIDGYINYGYMESLELIESPSSSYEDRKVGVKQSLTEITLNASVAPESAVRIRLSGRDLRRSSLTSDVDSWVGGLTLKPGHYYKAEARYLSGTIVVPEGVEYPGVSVYKTGGHEKIADKLFRGYDSEMLFVADGDSVNLVMYIPAGIALSKVVYQVLLKDVTADNESNTDNLFDGRSVSQYNEKTHVLSGTANQLYHLTLMEIDNEDPCTYNFEWDYCNTAYEDGTAGPTIAALDENGNNVEITSVSAGTTQTSIKLTNFSAYIHRSIAVTFPATARKIVFGKNGSPDDDVVYYFKEIKVVKLPAETVRKWASYYPHQTATDHIAREEAKNFGFLHDGAILRMDRLPDPIPVDENHLDYNDFIEQTWDTLLQNNYTEGDPYNPNTTKIRNVFVERVTRWTSTPYGTNIDTYPIHRYTFTPRNGYEKTVLLTSGCHGNEAEGYWGLFRLIKMIYFEGYKYPTLRNLRNVRFIIVPSWNPWGMQHYRRYNAFCALNTPTYDGGKTHQAWNWLFKSSHSITVGDVVYNIEDVGEANVIWETLNEYKDAISLWIDFHTDPYSGRSTENVDIDDPRPYEDPYGCYGYSAIGSKTFYRMSNVIEDFYYMFRNELNFSNYYHARESAPGTGFTSWQASLGFPCALVEVSTFMNDFPYASGSAEMMKIAQEFYGNCLAELLR